MQLPGDDYSQSGVPESATVSWLQITLVKVGVIIALPAFIMGAEIGFSMGLPRAALAMVIGAALLAVLATLTGTVAVRSRQSTSLLVRYAFGTLGARIVSAILAITLLGLFGVTAELFGASLAGISGSFMDNPIGIAPSIIGGGLLMIITTIYGFKGLQRLADFAVPVLLLGLVMIAYHAVKEAAPGVLTTVPESAQSLGIGISAVIGGLAVSITIFPDISRFARSVGHAQMAAAVSYGVGTPAVLLLAAVPSIVVGERDLVMIMTSMGLGVPAFLFLVFTAWTTNSGNLYSSGLGLASVFKGLSFPLLAGVAGVIGVAFALLGVSNKFLPFLVLLSITIPPVAGIYLADFFIVRRRSYDLSEVDRLPAIAWPAFMVWIAAFLVAFAGAQGVLTLTGIPACDAIALAFIGHSGVAWLRGDIARHRAAGAGATEAGHRTSDDPSGRYRRLDDAMTRSPASPQTD